MITKKDSNKKTPKKTDIGLMEEVKKKQTSRDIVIGVIDNDNCQDKKIKELEKKIMEQSQTLENMKKEMDQLKRQLKTQTTRICDIEEGLPFLELEKIKTLLEQQAKEIKKIV